MNREAWTSEQIAHLKREYATTPTTQLAATLGHPVASVRTKANQLGLHKANWCRRRLWTDVEIALLRERYADAPTNYLAREIGRPLSQVYRKSRKLGLKKSDVYLASSYACRLRRGDNVGAQYRFKKGHVPANKGLRRPGWSAGRMHETQFKKGQKSQNWLPIGTEVVKSDGYLYRKLTDTGYPPRDWRQVHRLLWEEHYGPIPDGYHVRFIDGDRRNVTIGNLCLVSRADLAAINRMWNRYPYELAHAIQLRGALIRKINRRNRHEKQN